MPGSGTGATVLGRFSKMGGGTGGFFSKNNALRRQIVKGKHGTAGLSGFRKAAKGLGAIGKGTSQRFIKAARVARNTRKVRAARGRQAVKNFAGKAAAGRAIGVAHAKSFVAAALKGRLPTRAMNQSPLRTAKAILRGGSSAQGKMTKFAAGKAAGRMVRTGRAARHLSKFSGK